MKLSVFTLGREVAVLESIGDFKSALTYHASAEPSDLISLTMRVRSQSYIWDDQLPPVLQMNLPEGYLLQILQEQFGPHIGANPLALLTVIGRYMVGRTQVAAQGASLAELPAAIDVQALLRGDNSAQAFAELVRAHAMSGVSGVVPKFLDAQQKASVITRKHIIKGSTPQLPYIALNEHLCMQVAAKVMPTAKTEISDDAQALVVHRFDVDAQGQLHWGMEDFCALLGLRPSAKYDTTWERIAKAVRDLVSGEQQQQVLRGLATQLLLSYALRNADCHAKNIALLYSSHADAHLAPTYDMLTTSVYAGYEHNPPSIGFMGKKTWLPGKNLQRFLASQFSLPLKEQVQIVEAISEAVLEVSDDVRYRMREHDGFHELGKRMLFAWSEGVQGLRNKRSFAMPAWPLNDNFTQLSAPIKPKRLTERHGRSPLLGRK